MSYWVDWVPGNIYKLKSEEGFPADHADLH